MTKFLVLLGESSGKNAVFLLPTFICHNYFKNWNQQCCRSVWAWYENVLIAYQINHAHAETLMDLDPTFSD